MRKAVKILLNLSFMTILVMLISTATLAAPALFNYQNEKQPTGESFSGSMSIVGVKQK